MKQLAVNSIRTQIELILGELPVSEKKIAEYILSHTKEVTHMTIHQVAKEAEASSAAVVRFCRSLGVTGFPDLKARLYAEVEHMHHVGYFDIEPNEKAQSIIDKTLSNTVQTLHDTVGQLETKSIGKAVNFLRDAEVIYIYGVGASFLIAEDVAQKWIRLGKKAYAISDRHLLAVAMATQSENALLWGVSYSGETRDVIELMKTAKELGLKTISLSRLGNSKISELADVSLFTARAPEAKFRSAATSSRFAQLLVVDVVFFAYSSSQYEFTVKQLEKTKHAIQHLHE
ncbi:MurR/RpiR family transcriptional regulator [Bacillus sp. DX1.1]|uniref:MurR/RpiR family transcriptional regulator n=1 Tax=unclassified Bacillus (in: firmicutes) TaxID=185979 RepID=UPI0025710BD7|nr:MULTISPECIES: MurR/RpiR family transcriptional regulator [unclassified Bacillus (in: firmicutes)]MDM5155926.1 MurR/RpiR family transcriptional regulator [Bacillus sp. DX1.1]WJE80220.1 MurR/RpiR family transcriptional regulator [Bacillus sp. DX3.1]